MIRRLFFFLSAIVLLLTACSDNDSFSAGSSYRLTFSEDTVRLDTLFSTVPSTTHSFWVYNNSGDGIRIRNVRLERGNQSGFRANVDGTFLNPVATDLEVRKGDSIRVFIEITARENMQPTPQLVEDHLLFALESGVEQRVNLRTYAWDAQKVTDLVVSSDMTINQKKPLVLYGKGITVADGATLTIKNTTLFFHDGAGIDVKGRLVGDSVVMRGDRLDHMFDYLPYDRISGQWRGITVAANSKGIKLTDCTVRNTLTALWCDSTKVELTQTVIHNCKGHGLYAHDSDVTMKKSLISNTLNDCLALHGTSAVVDSVTLAQFYPFSASRGAALRFAKTQKPMSLTITNTMATGYDDDTVFGDGRDGETVNFSFKNCLLRTPEVNDAEAFVDMIWEKPTDAIQGKAHFINVDESNFIYDFRLKEESPASQHGIGWPGR